MQREYGEKDELEKCYIELYRCMVEKDLDALSNILGDGFVLVHMTGMEQDKQTFVRAVGNGTLNYYHAEHEHIRAKVNGDHAELIGQSIVTAAVFGGGKHTWKLQLRVWLTNQNKKWMIDKAVASTY